MPGHDDRRVDVRRVRAELDVQRLREALHGELGRGVRGVLGALAWGDNSVSSCGSYSPATGPGTSAGALPMGLSLSGEGLGGPRRGAKGSCGTPGTP
jgi:hypothetical protein